MRGKMEVAAVLLGVGIKISDEDIVKVKDFKVLLTDEKVKKEITDVLDKHYSFNELLKLKPGIPLGEQYPQKEIEIKL